jgi:hypothetical protein
LVKNTNKTNRYLEHIRDTHDPSLHLKTLEDELKGTISKALGNQGDKVLQLVNKMNQERVKYEEFLVRFSAQQQHHHHKQQEQLPLDNQELYSTKLSLYKSVQNHNQLRKQALNARWELLVHRQAVGFITNNYKFVHENFPIPEILMLPGNEDDWKPFESDEEMGMEQSKISRRERRSNESVIRNFGDQLDWWERIGRWR